MIAQNAIGFFEKRELFFRFMAENHLTEIISLVKPNGDAIYHIPVIQPINEWHIGKTVHSNVDAYMINKKFKLSKEAYIILGYETGESEFNYENLLKMVHPAEVLHLNELINHVLNVPDFTVYKDTFRLLDKDGPSRFIKTKFVLKYNFQQHLLRINGFIQDITDLIMLEERLLESEEKFLSLALRVNEAAMYWLKACETISPADKETHNIIEHAEKERINKPVPLTYVNPEIQYSEIPHPLKRRENWQTQQ